MVDGCTNYDLRCTIYDVRITMYELRFTMHELRFTMYELGFGARAKRYKAQDGPIRIVASLCLMFHSGNNEPTKPTPDCSGYPFCKAKRLQRKAGLHIGG